MSTNDLSIGSTETKYIKLNTKTQNIFCCVNENLTAFLYTLTTFFSFCFLVPPVKVYKKVIKFSFTKQKIFWVLVFSFMYLVSVDPMDRSLVHQRTKHRILVFGHWLMLPPKETFASEIYSREFRHYESFLSLSHSFSSNMVIPYRPCLA